MPSLTKLQKVKQRRIEKRSQLSTKKNIRRYAKRGSQERRARSTVSGMMRFLNKLGIAENDASILQQQDMTMWDLDLMAHHQSRDHLFGSFHNEGMSVESANILADALTRRKRLSGSRKKERKKLSETRRV